MPTEVGTYQACRIATRRCIGTPARPLRPSPPAALHPTPPPVRRRTLHWHRRPHSTARRTTWSARPSDSLSPGPVPMHGATTCAHDLAARVQDPHPSAARGTHLPVRRQADSRRCHRLPHPPPTAARVQGHPVVSAGPGHARRTPDRPHGPSTPRRRAARCRAAHRVHRRGEHGAQDFLSGRFQPSMVPAGHAPVSACRPARCG